MAEPDLKDSSMQLLGVFADRHCISILQAIDKKPKSVSQIGCDCCINLGVVYRKLNLLKKAGLVDSYYKIRTDGKKFFLFSSLLDHARFSFDGDNVFVEVDLREKQPASLLEAK
ncbi:MAG TPA: hypothetical protein VJ792_02840 [Candidatus Nitrosotalea sp.]|nr:hypothetical protein [Candidatus Nitrosotalea sp.]